jgi:hypothetical protein
MIQKTIYSLFVTLFIIGCDFSETKRDTNAEDSILEHTNIPSNAYLASENKSFSIFLVDEKVGDSIAPLPPIKQVSLWAYNKKKGTDVKILLSHPHANGSWFSMEHSVSIPLDSIPTISKVTILSWESEPLKILAEGCSDYRNVQSFIIDINSDKAICLPTNRGLIGISEEDALLIMQSYEYYRTEDGKYNIIEGFNMDGRRICKMEAKMYHK